MLANAGRTVVYTDPVEANPEDQLQSLRALVADMKSGAVSTLLVLGGNPVFNSPADLAFREAFRKVPRRVHLSLESDETSVECQWNVAEAHFLESWSDARAFDGTVSIVQPLIAPLYGGRSAHEVVAALSEQPEKSAYELVRERVGEEAALPLFDGSALGLAGSSPETHWVRAASGASVSARPTPSRAAARDA